MRARHAVLIVVLALAGCGGSSENERLVDAALKKLGDGRTYEADVELRIKADGTDVELKGKGGFDGKDEVGTYSVSNAGDETEVDLLVVDGEQYYSPVGRDAWERAPEDFMTRPLLEPVVALKLAREEDLEDKGVTEIRGRETRFLQARVDAGELGEHLSFPPLAKYFDKHADETSQIPTYLNVYIDERDKTLVRQELSMIGGGSHIVGDADYLSFGKPIDVKVPADLAEG